MHSSAWAEVLLNVPWILASIMVVACVASIVRPREPLVAWLAVIVFLASGLLVFWRPAETVLAHLLFRVRRPTAAEQAKLERAWDPVRTSAGLSDGVYSLWVQDSTSVNAFASAGHIVAVTRVALRLPPRQLSAILAHELGHHLGGHAWVALLVYWYSLPGRYAWRALYWANRVAVGVASTALAVVGGVAGGFWLGYLVASLGRVAVAFFPLLWWGLIAYCLYAMHPAFLLVFMIPLVLAFLSRRGELYADRWAADLGFGPPLIEVLQGWVDAGADDDHARGRLRASLFATHPRSATRIVALERHLGMAQVG